MSWALTGRCRAQISWVSSCKENHVCRRSIICLFFFFFHHLSFVWGVCGAGNHSVLGPGPVTYLALVGASAPRSCEKITFLAME